MKFDPSLPRDGINVGRTHPLRELALLLTGFLAVAMLLVIVVGAAIDFVVPRLPPGLESRIFGPVWVTSEVRDHAVSEAEDNPHLDCAREL